MGAVPPTTPSRRTTTALQAANAKRMRRDMTEPERLLWRAIRQRIPVEGTHFRRQVPVDRYIVDFCAFGAKLIVEVDGNQHGTDEAIAHDGVRTARLEQLGYRVVRFSNHDVMANIDSVLDTIFANLPAPETPTPGPSPQGRGEALRHATRKRQSSAKPGEQGPFHSSPMRGGAGVGASPLYKSPRTRAASTQEP